MDRIDIKRRNGTSGNSGIGILDDLCLCLLAEMSTIFKVGFVSFSNGMNIYLQYDTIRLVSVDNR